MAGTGSNGNSEAVGGSGPSTVVLAGAFAVIGILLAVGLAFVAGGFAGTSAGATSSLPPSALPSGAPSLVAVASPSVEPLPSDAIPGDTSAPTAAPVLPTGAPTGPSAPSPTPNT